MTDSLSPATPKSCAHPHEDSIPERYAVNAFEMALRHLALCECESMPCEHVAAYNAARVRLLNEIHVLRSGEKATYDPRTQVVVDRAKLVLLVDAAQHDPAYQTAHDAIEHYNFWLSQSEAKQ